MPGKWGGLIGLPFPFCLRDANFGQMHITNLSNEMQYRDVYLMPTFHEREH